MTGHEFTGSDGIRYPEAVADFDFGDQMLLEQAQSSGDIHVQGFVGRLHKRSGDFEPGTELYGRVARALNEPDPETASTLQFDAGVEVGAYVLNRYTTPRARIMGHLAACHEIDRIKVGLHGFDASGIAMNRIMHYSCLTVADELEPSDKNWQVANIITDTLKELSEPYPKVGWFVPKASAFMQVIGDRFRVHYALEDNAPPLETSETVDGNEAEAMAKFLMDYVMEQRRYGLKPAYIPASIGGSWVFYDGYQVARTLHGKEHADKQIVPMIATIMHTKKSDMRDLQFGKPTDKRYGPGTMRQVQGAFAELTPDLILNLSEAGDIYVDTFGWRKLKDELKDNPARYAAVAAELISNVHDLTVPVEHITANGIRNITQLPPKQQKQPRPILDLLAPRVKAAKTPAKPGTETDRTVREHDVVWHIRILPTGWHASPEAITNATRVGIQLADNETFVQEHKRGLGSAVKGHKVIRRIIDSSI